MVASVDEGCRRMRAFSTDLHALCVKAMSLINTNIVLELKDVLPLQLLYNSC